MKSIKTNVRTGLFGLLTVAGSLALGGCFSSGPQVPQVPPVKAIAVSSSGVSTPQTGAVLLIVVLDETASFHSYWAMSVNKAVQSIASLRPGDAVMILGLDHHAFDQDDVLVEQTTLPMGSMRAAQAKATLLARVRKLEPRSTSSGAMINGVLRGEPEGTDTLGIIDMASYLAAKSPGFAVNLAVCSDFEDEKVPKTGASNEPSPFPNDTHFVALYVGTHGHTDLTSRINRWIKKLKPMNLNCAPNDFHIASESWKTSVVARPAQ